MGKRKTVEDRKATYFIAPRYGFAAYSAACEDSPLMRYWLSNHSKTSDRVLVRFSDADRYFAKRSGRISGKALIEFAENCEKAFEFFRRDGKAPQRSKYVRALIPADCKNIDEFDPLFIHHCAMIGDWTRGRCPHPFVAKEWYYCYRTVKLYKTDVEDELPKPYIKLTTEDFIVSSIFGDEPQGELVG